MRLITSLGRGVTGWEGGALAISAGDTLVIPAEVDAWIEGNLTLLMSATCDRARLTALLGEKAGQVAGYDANEK